MKLQTQSRQGTSCDGSLTALKTTVFKAHDPVWSSVWIITMIILQADIIAQMLSTRRQGNVLNTETDCLS